MIDVWLIHDNKLSALIPASNLGMGPGFFSLVPLEETPLGTLGVADLRRISLYLDSWEINGIVCALGVGDLYRFTLYLARKKRGTRGAVAVSRLE